MCRVLAVAMSIFFCLAGCSSRYTIQSPRYARYNGEIDHHACMVHAPKNRIFRILTNNESFEKLCPKWIIVTREPPAPFGPGTIAKTRVNQRIRLGWNSKVVQVTPNKIIRQRFLDGFFAGGTEIWELDAVGQYTRVSHTIIVNPRGLLRKLIWNLKVRKKHDWMVESFLQNLKKLAEANQVSPHAHMLSRIME